MFQQQQEDSGKTFTRKGLNDVDGLLLPLGRTYEFRIIRTVLKLDTVLYTVLKYTYSNTV